MPLARAYGGRGARHRLEPFLRRLGELAGKRLILFVHDPFAARQPFPDDFFRLVERYSTLGPITDWVPDLQGAKGLPVGAPPIEEMGAFIDPLASRLRLRMAYCNVARVEHRDREPKLLLSGYRERARRPGTTVILSPNEVGVAVFSGSAKRFPDDLRQQEWFPVVNPPLLDEALEHKWLLNELLHGTPSAKLLAPRLPVGLGMVSGQEIRAFSDHLQAPGGFPLAVLEPSLQSLYPGRRFLDRTALRALAARQPERHAPRELLDELLCPSISHRYEEITGYHGKQLDNFLRTPAARVQDHGDGTFHFSAPYPFLETTVSLLRPYVEARPIRSRKTGKLHRGALRVVTLDRKIVAAVHHLVTEPDDGTFQDLGRPEVATFYEAASAEDEAMLQEQLGPFVRELEEQSEARIRGAEDTGMLLRAWVRRHGDYAVDLRH